MDFEKLLKIASTYLSQYVSDFLHTLREPWMPEQAQSSRLISALGEPIHQDNAITAPQTILDANLWVFVFLSIFIGFSLSVVASKSKGAELQIVLVYVAISWVAFSAYAFVLARYALGGTGDFVHCLRASLYSLGVIYVIASFVSMLGSLALPKSLDADTKTTLCAVMYLAIQGSLAAYLLGKHFRALHSLKGIRLAVFVLLAPIPIVSINLFVSLLGAMSTIPIQK